MNNQILGSIAALVSAVSWGVCIVLWRMIGEKISPISINLCKGIIGCLYLFIVLLFIGFESVDINSYLFLVLSGVFGIAISDTFFFKALLQLGPRFVSIMGALAPVLIAIAATIFLGEQLSAKIWIGIFIVVGGLICVLSEKTTQNNTVKNKSLGIKYALISLFTLTAGVLLAKIGVESVSTIQATFIRILAGIAALIVWGFYKRDLKKLINPLYNFKLLKKMNTIVLIGVFGGFWLSLVSLKLIDASIASTLNSTTPIFILPMMALFFKEKISLKTSIATVITVMGIGMIFYK